MWNGGEKNECVWKIVNKKYIEPNEKVERIEKSLITWVRINYYFSKGECMNEK